MNCKHLQTRGNTTKYYWCGAKSKQINGYECNNCLLKLPCIDKSLDKIFGTNNGIIDNLYDNKGVEDFLKGMGLK